MNITSFFSIEIQLTEKLYIDQYGGAISFIRTATLINPNVFFSLN